MTMKTTLLGVILTTTAVLGFSTTVSADSIYTVKSGDTLSEIIYDLQGSTNDMQAIAQENNINNLDLIYAGQKLTISDDGVVREATSEEVATQNEVETVVEAAPVVDNTTTNQSNVTETAPQGTQLTVETTAYDGISLGGVTASGYIIQSTADKVIAVDPNVIPLGSTVYVPGYGTAIAADTGGAIQGNIIDLNMSTSEAINWGRRTVTITILN